MSVDKKKWVFIGASVVMVVAVLALILGGDEERKSRIGEDAEVFLFDEPVRSSAMVLGEGYVRFTHPEYGFSLEYPEDLSMTAYREKKEGETIVFENADAVKPAPISDRRGFQVFVVPFGEDEKITRERILEDVPFVTIDEPQEVVIGESSGRNIPALLFWSEAPRIGRTREVWFVHDGFLYEVTTYAHRDEELAKILSTWSFQN